MGIEPTTSSLGSLRSTTELRPQRLENQPKPAFLSSRMLPGQAMHSNFHHSVMTRRKGGLLSCRSVELCVRS